MITLWVPFGRFRADKGEPADTLSLPTGTAPSRPLANGKGAGAQPAERPPDPALVLIFSLPHRPSARFPHQRRKKRREMDDGLAEGGPQRSCEVQRSPTARVETCISCLHPQLPGHLETPADPEFHPTPA